MQWLLLFTFTLGPCAWAMRPGRIAQLRRETVDMFYHGYDNYMNHAFPEDEVSARMDEYDANCTSWHMLILGSV
jgi:hypothetical protein